MSRQGYRFANGGDGMPVPTLRLSRLGYWLPAALPGSETLPPIRAGAAGDVLIVGVAGLNNRIRQAEGAIVKAMCALLPAFGDLPVG